MKSMPSYQQLFFASVEDLNGSQTCLNTGKDHILYKEKRFSFKFVKIFDKP
jgi:hypothetical protein